MNFKTAVEAAPHPVSGAYHPGKQALENRHRNLVDCDEPTRLTGSIDLDSTLKQEPGYASAHRWDYGLGYRPKRGPEQAVWVEVHSAKTDEVGRVLAKLKWLRTWLNSEGRQLGKLTRRADDRIRFVWIASNGVHISKNSPQAKTLSKSAIRVTKRLSLP